MSIGFGNLALLFGLAAVAIPVLIHLLHRRRYDVVDWGAMQFLEVSRTTRRRILLEEILLMLLRMAVIAVFVLALAGPYATGMLADRLAGRPSRELVVLIDGSASMGFDSGAGPTPHDVARRAVSDALDDLASDDRVALFLVRESVTPLVPALTTDHTRVRAALADVPTPRGVADWPGAVEDACRLLGAQGRHARRDILIVRDSQRWSWADADTLERWKRVAHHFQSGSSTAPSPRLSVVETATVVPKSMPSNYALAPLRTGRSIAWTGQNVKFSIALHLKGFTKYERPWRLRLEVDGKPARDLPVPDEGPSEGQVGITFKQVFASPGAHLVSLIVDPDLPPEKRPPAYRVKDCLPADNRQDHVIDVFEALPVLLVDGGDPSLPESSTFFAKRALEQSPDPARPPVWRVQTVSANDLTPAHLAGGKQRPAVAILADVARLRSEQAAALEKFVAEGGGLLVAPGPRGERDVYNEALFKDGGGLLPARLERLAGDANTPDSFASPAMTKTPHPALGVVAQSPTLGQARFGRWWRLSPGKDAVVVADLSTNDPLFVERAFHQGRVLVSAIPLDRSWDSNLPGLLDYPVLMHELTMYLAGGHAPAGNVAAGQPLRYRPGHGQNTALPANLVLTPPYGSPERFQLATWPWHYDEARAPGVYRLTINENKTAYFVVQSDPRESDLTPCGDEERRAVADIVPVEYGTAASHVTESGQAHDVWWLLLVLVCLLLACEVWMTRRMVLRS